MSQLWYMIIAGAGILMGVAALIYARAVVYRQWMKVDKMLSISGKDLKGGEYCLDETLDAKIYQSIQNLYRDLELEYKEADTEKEAVKAYIADLSHQMKTPLANLNLYYELLLEEGLSSEEVQDFHNKIHSETKKMEWLLSSLTKITRLESGAIAFSVQEDMLAPVILKAVDSVQELASKKRISLHAENKSEVCVLLNQKWLLEAIVNLLENAIKYSKEESSITISVEQLELYVRVHIKDTGIGIEQKDYQRIFQRFYRGKNAADLPGSGLGLYLAQLILNKQGGYITVRSELDQGSCFSIYLRRQL